MDPYLAEFVGTAILILLGNGVVANVVLNRTKGHEAGWIVITAGWGFAVFVGVLCVGEISGAHLNPAVSIALALVEKNNFQWDQVPGYIAAQMAGAIVGTVLVYLCYKDHYDATDDADAKLATFCTAPAIRSIPRNLLCEALGTFILVATALLAVETNFQLPGMAETDSVKVGLGSVGALPVGLVVFSIGLSLGGTTGYAINPARDLGPRIAHDILPIKGKRDSDWSYAFVPVVGPIVGAILAALAFNGV
jgi:glycerol uptake facilitator protein